MENLTPELLQAILENLQQQKVQVEERSDTDKEVDLLRLEEHMLTVKVKIATVWMRTS